MSKQVATILGDAEFEHISLAVSKSGGTMYGFLKEAAMRHADLILATEKAPIVEEMIDALRNRKWNLYQHDDYSDNNHRAWLKTRFPTAIDRQVQEAVTQFRLAQKVPR